MFLKSKDHREAFEEIVASELGVKVAKVRAERAKVKDYSSKELCKYWFINENDDSPILIELKKRLRTQAALFSWAYGPESRIVRDLLYVKLPSTEKRRLVNLVLAAARNKYPWLLSRHIHAMAFQPRAFRNLAPSPNEEFPLEPWGPLYQKALLPKGKRKRMLWIPNPPLKRIQSILLGLIGPPLAESLPATTYGVGFGRSGNIFRNIAAHLGNKYIASFDIQDFFPSTRISDVLIGLKRSEQIGLLMINAQQVPGYLRQSPQIRNLRWKSDAQVLVAKLATYRGRLPQGSPLSPLLASVAFSRFDDFINQRLIHLFGKREFQYTRYCDDITISITAQAAKNQQLNSPSEVMTVLQNRIDNCLCGSNYRLKKSKSICNQVAHGHPVTGLRIKDGQIGLRRNQRRYLRETCYKLQTGKFVSLAREWAMKTNLKEPKFKSITQGHRWESLGGRKYRCSAERIAIQMLRRLYPDLRVERILRDWYVWQDRLSDSTNQVGGRQAFRLLEWILAALWSGNLTAKRSKTGKLLFSQDGTDVCAVLADSDLNYFLLPHDQAISVACYWNHLRGLISFLAGSPDSPEYSSIHQNRAKLSETLAVVQIESMAEQIANRQEADSTLLLTTTDHINRLASTVMELFEEYCTRIDIEKSAIEGIHRVRSRFRQPVRDVRDWYSWLNTCAKIFVYGSYTRPNGSTYKERIPMSGIWSYFRIKSLHTSKKIAGDYRIVDEMDQLLGITKLDLDHNFTKAQVRILEELQSHLDSERKNRRADGRESWLKNQPKNLWHHGEYKALILARDNFLDLHEQLRTTEDERRIFQSQSAFEINSLNENIEKFDDGMGTDKCWIDIRQFATELYRHTCESIEPLESPVSPPEGTSFHEDWKRLEVWKREFKPKAKYLNLIKDLRNRGSHQGTPERRKDWVEIQNKIARILNRSWTSKSGKRIKEFFAPDDLEISPIELVTIKLLLLNDINGALSQIAESRGWD